MVDFSFSLLGNSGKTLIDAKLQTFALVESGTKNTVAKTTQGGTSKLVIDTSSYSLPIVAIAPSANTALLYGNTFVSDLAVGSAVPYWIFDAAASVALGSRSGLILDIFDAAGSLVYSMTQKQARIRDVINTDTETLNLTTNTYDTGRNYAVAWACGAGKKVWEEGAHPGSITDWWLQMYSMGARVSNPSVTFKYLLHSWGTPPSSSPGSDTLFTAFQALIIDVTGL